MAVQQPDAGPGPRLEESLIFEDRGADPTESFQVQRYGELLRYKNTNGVWTVLDEEQHRSVRQLIHFLAGGGPGEGFGLGPHYCEITPTTPFPTSEIWYETSGKVKKIVEVSTTWTGAFPTTEVTKVYKLDGTNVAAQATDTITYSGPFISTISRAIVVY